MQACSRVPPIFWLLILSVSGCGAGSAPSISDTGSQTLPPPKAPASLPNLQAAIGHYDFAKRPPVWIACFGPSTLQGATLADATDNAPCQHFVQQLQAHLDPYHQINFESANFGVNGSVEVQFPAAWQAMNEALSGVTVEACGTGYAVGDIETVNQNSIPGRANYPSGAVQVTSVGPGGCVTGVKLTPYVNLPYITDTPTPTVGGYVVTSSVPVINGYQNGVSISGQTGMGSGLTLAITSVGVKPAVVLSFYAMNDMGAANYNGGETIDRYRSSLEDSINTVKSSGADSIVVTSPHPSVALWAPTLYLEVPTYCYHPGYTNVCSPSDVIPDPVLSVATADFALTGTSITQDSRMLDVNAAARTAARSAGASLIDAEPFWFASLQNFTAALGSQQLAEEQLFNAGQSVHPNLLGDQDSYWKAMASYIAKL